MRETYRAQQMRDVFNELPLDEQVRLNKLFKPAPIKN